MASSEDGDQTGSNGEASSSCRDQLSNDQVPAAFWDALPSDQENPDLLAIKALQEESTPEERAETLKVSQISCIFPSLHPQRRSCVFSHQLASLRNCSKNLRRQEN